ncbi:hypothetical protein E8E12_010990 [Didymella heteroderae]|uniref:Uncharacterized protein n=1 Tax=Didymella heteroderae TaxID=1769908 RepID=A0A9P5C4N4_9PLEO|nr:hypothetical protein E8E12_010990 [Didymella heteroderae]
MSDGTPNLARKASDSRSEDQSHARQHDACPTEENNPSIPVSQQFVAMMARGSPTVPEAADMAATIRALEAELDELRCRERKARVAAVHAFGINSSNMMKTYHDCLEVLGDEHARRWIQQFAPKGVEVLDEVRNYLENVEGREVT